MAGGEGGAASPLASAALPLNQGRFGTCVGHAFAQALTTGVQEKYGVPCYPTLVVEKIQTLCECWEGHFTERMPPGVERGARGAARGHRGRGQGPAVQREGRV